MEGPFFVIIRFYYIKIGRLIRKIHEMNLELGKNRKIRGQNLYDFLKKFSIKNQTLMKN